MNDYESQNQPYELPPYELEETNTFNSERKSQSQSNTYYKPPSNKNSNTSNPHVIKKTPSYNPSPINSNTYDNLNNNVNMSKAKNNMQAPIKYKTQNLEQYQNQFDKKIKQLSNLCSQSQNQFGQQSHNQDNLMYFTYHFNIN